MRQAGEDRSFAIEEEPRAVDRAAVWQAIEQKNDGRQDPLAPAVLEAGRRVNDRGRGEVHHPRDASREKGRERRPPG